MTAPAIQEAKRIVARRRFQVGTTYLCASCRVSVVFREYEICLRCLGLMGKKERKS